MKKSITQVTVNQISFIFFLQIFFLNIYETSTAGSGCTDGVNGCSRCLNATACVACQINYRINSVLQCSSCIGTCSQCDLSTYKCDKGRSGFTNGGAPCNIVNCQTCAASADSCQKCLDGYEYVSSTQCRTCTSLNCKTCTNNAFGDACTSCLDGYFLSGSSCVDCSQPYCITCSAVGVCNSCAPSYGLVGGQCQFCNLLVCRNCDGDVTKCVQCEIRYGYSNITNKCEKCSQDKCAICSHDNTYCQKCDWQNYLTTINGQCLPCSDAHCQQCFINDQCIRCAIYYGVFNATCELCLDTNCTQCPTNYSNCFQCNLNYGATVDHTCLPCTLSPNNCLQCNRLNLSSCYTCPLGRYLVTETCVRCPKYCSDCYLNVAQVVQCTVCQTNHTLTQTSPILCSSNCGDFDLGDDEQCDNEVGRLYDGCTDLCKIEDNFTCFQLNKSVCSYNNTVYISLESLTQNDNQNNFTLKVRIWPPLYIFTIIDEQNLKVLFGLSPSSLKVYRVSFNSQFDILTFEGEITQTINLGETIYVNFMPSKMVDVVEYTATPDQTKPIMMQKNLILFVDRLKDIVLYLSYVLTVLFWISFILGVVLRKLPGLEAMFVIQIAYISLVYSNYSLLQISERVYPLKYSTGLNIELISEDKNLSRKQSLLPNLAENKLSEIYLLNNLNINLILELVLLIALAIVYFRLRRFISQNKMDNKTLDKQQLEQSLKEAEVHVDRYQLVHQFIMNAAMFNLAYFFACTSIFFKFGLATHIPSILVFCLQILFFIFTFVKFFHDPSLFDYFRFSFKTTPLAMQHYFFHILNIILIVLLLSLSELSWAPLIPVTLMLIYTIAYRPYKQTSDNIRSVFNMVVIMSFLLFRVYIVFICKCSEQQRKLEFSMTTTKLLYVANLLGLLVVVLVSILLSIWYYYQDYLLQQEQKNLGIKEGEKKQLNRRSFLFQLVRIDPNSKMDNVELDNAFKKLIEPNKSLLNATNEVQKIENIHQLEVSNERFLEAVKKNNRRNKHKGLKKEGIQFKQNKLFESIKQEEKGSVDKKKEEEEEMVAEIVKNERIYINLQSTMRVVHKIMETEQDLMAISQYDQIDANFGKRGQKKLNQKLEE